MGNSSSNNTKRDSSKSQSNPHQYVQIYEHILQLLPDICDEGDFPLSTFRQGTDMTTRLRLIEVVSNPRSSDEFHSLVVKLIWNDRPSLSRDEVTKIFRDCCIFDLKQAFIADKKHFHPTMLDNTCFSALINTIEPTTIPEIGQEQFYNWLRVNFITLFYGFELWLRKNVQLSTTDNTLSEISTKTYSLLPMDNILNQTWVWLLVHNLPILYLSSDKTCTNLFERMSSVLYGRMWDHLYDSHRDGSSLNRFQHHIFGYRGPLVMFFEISDGYLFCLCCDEEFRESPKHFGGIQACLFQLKPTFKLVVEGPQTIFMNTKLRGVSELGLSVGRDQTHTFLRIDGDFFNVKHMRGEGRLAAIDVWGVGGKASAEEQENLRDWEDKQIEKSRKVKRSYEEEEAILNMAGIETRHTQEQF